MPPCLVALVPWLQSSESFRFQEMIEGCQTRFPNVVAGAIACAWDSIRDHCRQGAGIAERVADAVEECLECLERCPSPC